MFTYATRGAKVDLDLAHGSPSATSPRVDFHLPDRPERAKEFKGRRVGHNNPPKRVPPKQVPAQAGPSLPPTPAADPMPAQQIEAPGENRETPAQAGPSPAPTPAADPMLVQQTEAPGADPMPVQQTEAPGENRDTPAADPMPVQQTEAPGKKRKPLPAWTRFFGAALFASFAAAAIALPATHHHHNTSLAS